MKKQKPFCTKAVRYGLTCRKEANKLFVDQVKIIGVDSICKKAICVDVQCRPVKITVEFIKKIPKGE